MAKVINRFELRLGDIEDTEAAIDIVQETIDNNRIIFQEEYHLWNELEEYGDCLQAETIMTDEDELCEQSREVFEMICKEVAEADPYSDFMAKHSYAYENTDSTLYMICFFQEKEMHIFYGEIVGNVGCMDAGHKDYEVDNGALILALEETYDNLYFDTDKETDNVVVEMLELYNEEEYPEL